METEEILILGFSPPPDRMSPSSTSSDEDVIEERVREICQKWKFDDHVKILEEILLPYKEIAKAYLGASDDGGWDKFGTEGSRMSRKFGDQVVSEKKTKTQGNIEDSGKQEILPKIDIELEYFVPGMDKNMLNLLYWKFVQLWSVTINYAVKAITIKIRTSFEADENDPHVYFDNLGEFGGYIHLFWRENGERRDD